MSTVDRATMLLKQDAAIRERIDQDTALDDAIDPGNGEFGPLAHPEQVQMRVAKRALMLKEGLQPYPVHLDVTDRIEDIRARYDGKLAAGEETEDMVGIAGRVLFLRNSGGLCFVQLSAGDGTKIQGMVSKREIGADSLKRFKQLVDLGDHLYLRGRVIASRTGELSVFATEWAIAAKALQPLPALHKELNDDTRIRKPYVGMIADDRVAFHTEFVGDGPQMLDRGLRGDLLTQRLGERAVHGHLLPFAAEIVFGAVQQRDLRRTVDILGGLLDELLDECRDGVVRAIGLIGLDHGEFGGVRGVDALVAEVAVDLEDAVDAADQAALEEELGGDAHVQIDVEGVHVGDEGLGRRTAVDGLQHRGLDLDEIVVVERTTQ